MPVSLIVLAKNYNKELYLSTINVKCFGFEKCCIFNRYEFAKPLVTLPVIIFCW